MPLQPWTDEEEQYLSDHYLITSIVEFARHLQKEPDEVKAMLEELDLRSGAAILNPTPHQQRRSKIHHLMQEHKRYLPNGWLVGLAMSRLMVRSLVGQVEESTTWVEEIEEEINEVLDAVVGAYEITPLLSVGDMLMGEDHGQAYRITGREFVPASKRITYYFTYLYGGGDIPEEYDDYEDDEDDDDNNDLLEIILHKN